MESTGGRQGKKKNFFVMFICPVKSYGRIMRVRLKFSITVADLRLLSDSEVPTPLDFLSDVFLPSEEHVKKLKKKTFLPT